MQCGITSLGELRILKFLENNNIEYIPQHSFPDCKYKRVLRFDFYLPKYNLCIEFDGYHHYNENRRLVGGDSLLVIQARDNIKNEYCLNNNIGMLRIPFWEKDNIYKILEDKLRDKFFELD